jgi:hypothetical protein
MKIGSAGVTTTRATPARHPDRAAGCAGCGDASCPVTIPERTLPASTADATAVNEHRITLDILTTR